MPNYIPTWKLWLEKAGKELRTAKVLLDISQDEHLETVLFLCQQVAEKAIKAYLAKNKIRFDKTHDIKKLLDSMSEFNQVLATQLELAIVLSKYAVALRYPEETMGRIVVDRELSDNSFKIANWVYLEMKNSLE